MTEAEFKPFPKIPRLRRNVVITEKIDGTNAQINIMNDGVTMTAGSRNRIITPASDNFGFAKWVQVHYKELLKLGPGQHFGEWWGAGIGRTYSQDKKRFSLFNTFRWGNQETRPECCGVVPVIYEGVFTNDCVDYALDFLRGNGSIVAPGFNTPEGVVVYHEASGQLFKVLLENDELPKGKVTYGESKVVCPL